MKVLAKRTKQVSVTKEIEIVSHRVCNFTIDDGVTGYRGLKITIVPWIDGAFLLPEDPR
jgi:hypothetical protein